MALGQKKTNVIIMPQAQSPWRPIASAPLRPLPGVVMAVIDPRPTNRGGIELPSEVAGHTMANSATIVAVGANTTKWRGSCPPVEMEVQPGDRVLVLPYAGTRYRQFRHLDYRQKDMRMYGLTTIKWEGLDGAESIVHDFEHYALGIPARLNGTNMQPIGDWILIKRDPRRTEGGGILLLDAGTLNSKGKWKATVIAASPKANEVGIQAGNRVIYHDPSAVISLDFMTESNFKAYGYEGQRDDYLLIRWHQCYAVLDAA